MDNSPRHPKDLSGVTVKGFRLDTKVGVGGFGAVYKAFQEIVEREVAVKVIRPKYANQIEFIRRFETEARIIARLEHMSIVPMYDYWRDPSGAYLVMRWLRGGNLRDQLTRLPHLELSLVVKVLNQIADALSIAHRRGVVHRDIKPENILLDEYGNAYLTDFGIAVDLVQNREATALNIPYGSPEYISPEQITHNLVTTQADIYSLGIMLYELLTNTSPYEYKTTEMLLTKHVRDPVPSLLRERPDLPPSLDTIIWRATAKQPNARYKDVMTMAVAFERAAGIQSPLMTTQPHLPGGMTPHAPSNVNTARLNPPGTPASSKSNTGSLSDFASTRRRKQADLLEAEDSHTTGERLAANITHETDKLEQARGIDSETRKFFDPKLESQFTEELPGSAKRITFEDEDDEAARQSDYLNIRNPYKGLRPFEEGDASDFFGREELVGKLLNSLGEQQFITLVGPSGSGKSSVVKAGLIPQLRQGKIKGSDRWFIISIVPGTDPFRELSEALLSISIRSPYDLSEILQRDEADLYQITSTILPDAEAGLLIYVDQFEELFTLCESEEDRLRFLKLLHKTMTDSRGRIRIVLTLRADFYDRPLLYAEFGELVREHTEVVLPLTISALKTVIIKPAENARLQLEKGLAEQIVQEINDQTGALPLLQYAMAELYERRKGNLLTTAAYETIGGISGALAQRAEQLYQELAEPAQQLVQQLFLRLVTIQGDRAGATKQRILWPDIFSGIDDKQQMQVILDSFGKYRLLTLDRDPQTRLPTVEIAHEALISGWDRLRDWINRNRADLQTRAELVSETGKWLESNRDSGYLARGSELAGFERLLEKSTLAIGEQEAEFVQHGIRLRQHIEYAKRAAIAVLALISIIVAGLAVIAQNNATEAQRQSQIARSRELAARSLAVEDNALGLLLSVEANAHANTIEAQDSLLTLLQSEPFVMRYMHGHEDAVRATIYNPAGTQIASGACDRMINIWDVDGRDAVMQLSGHDGCINTLAFHPDGVRLASGSNDSSVRIWDSTSGESRHELLNHEAVVWSVAFSPDGQLLASGDESGHLLIWNVETGAVLEQLTGAHDGAIFAAKFSPDGQILATGGGDNLIRLWDTNSWVQIGEALSGHDGWVLTLDFNPAGNLVASSGFDSNVLIWEIESQQVIFQVATGTTAPVRQLAFAADPRFLAIALEDFTIQLWNLEANQQVIVPLAAHQGGVWGLDFHPNRLALVSGAGDSRVILWDIHIPQRPGIRALQPQMRVEALDWNAEANLYAAGGAALDLASTTNPGPIEIHDATDHEVILRLNGHLGPVNSLAISPDGTRLVSSSADETNTIILWNTNTGEEITRMTGHAGLITNVLFTPDGEQIISTDEENNLRRWRSIDGAALGEPIVTPLERGIVSTSISPDGRYLAAGGRTGAIYIWDLETDELLDQALQVAAENDTTDPVVMALVFDRDSQMLMAGYRNSDIVVWDFKSGATRLPPLQGHTDWVLSLAISPDNQLLASGGRDGTVRLWDIDTGVEVGLPLIGHDDWVNDLVFVDHGTRLISGGQDGTLIIWDTNLTTLSQRACEIANRNLSKQEWQRFVPDEPFRMSCTRPFNR